PGNGSFGVYWAMAVTATGLLSPHSQWYELGLLILPMWLLLDWRVRPSVEHEHALAPELTAVERMAMVGAFVITPYSDPFRFVGGQPLSVIPVLILLWAARLRPTSSEPAAKSALARSPGPA